MTVGSLRVWSFDLYRGLGVANRYGEITEILLRQTAVRCKSCHLIRYVEMQLMSLIVLFGFELFEPRLFYETSTRDQLICFSPTDRLAPVQLLVRVDQSE